MAFNKVSMVVMLVLLVVATAEAADSKFCTKCECKKDDYGVTKCHRYERKVGGCPIVCGSPCACTRMNPPTCWCNYEVDTCSPAQCSNNAATGFSDFLNLNGN